MNLFEDEIKRLEQKIGNYPAHPVVFFGSSTIRLWTTLEQDFPHVQTLNLGFGGSTLAACGWYVERLLVPAQPQSVIIYAGDNDLAEGRQPEEVYLFFCALACKMQQYLPGVPLDYISIKPSIARWPLIANILAANRFIAKEIQQLPNATFVDITATMLTQAGQPRPELFQADGLHLSSAGYALWQKQLAEKSPALNGVLV